MANQPSKSEVRLYTLGHVSEDLLLAIHTPEFVENLKKQRYYEGAFYSVRGCVEAVEQILSCEIENALVFTVCAGHHAERDHAWGGPQASCAGPALYNARKQFGPTRCAVLDTDSHQGNGTRAIFADDSDVLHMCFCSTDVVEGQGSKICVNCGWRTTDDHYLEKVRKDFVARLHDFRPDLVLHNFAHDTCQGDYGDRGLTPEFVPRLAREMRDHTREVSQGRYLLVTHGGDRVEIADYIFPQIIEILRAR